MLCSNCDVNEPVIKCRECPQGENSFCKLCGQLHLKIKAFKKHHLDPVHRELCCNCEINFASYVCKHCIQNESCYCTECALLHPQIKQFRNHQIEPLQSLTVGSSKTSTQSVSSQIMELYSEAKSMVSFVVRKGVESALDQPNLALVGIAMFLLILVLRLLFGRNAAIILIVCIVIALKFYLDYEKVELKAKVSFAEPPPKTTRPAVNLGMKNSTSQQTSEEIDEIADADFADEFWHTKPYTQDETLKTGLSTGPKPPAFRPRNRPYKR